MTFSITDKDKSLAIVIIGATGRMGALFMRAFTEISITAHIDVRGVDLPFAPEEVATACAEANVAIFCVPAAFLPATLKTITPHLPTHCIVTDITSVKIQPMEQMERAWTGAVVGTHPLFGPSALLNTPIVAESNTPQDLPVAIVAGQKSTEKDVALIENLFIALCCRVFLCTAEEHDKAMAAIQNLNFISSLAYFATLADREELLPFLTPSFQRRRVAAQKMLTEDAELFAGLFAANPHSHDLVRRYRAFLNIAAGGDIELLTAKADCWW